MPILGEIRMFGGTFAPRGWMFCQGQILAISTNDALFALLGSIYGGDGQSTFALPDLRGRAPLHAGQGQGLSAYTEGRVSGVESVTLTTTQLPAHNHTFQSQCNTDSSKTTAFSGANAYPGATSAASYAAATDGMTGSAQGTGGITGGSQPHENMQPFLAVNFIIATEGIFPSRN